MILFGISSLFFYKWYFSNDKPDLDKTQIDKSKSIIDSLNIVIVKNNKRLDSLSLSNDILENKIKNVERSIIYLKDKSNKSESDLLNLKTDLDIANKKYEQLKNNPPNRTGNDLLESIKNKTKL